MATNQDEVRKAAMAELAKRELARRQSSAAPASGPQRSLNPFSAYQLQQAKKGFRPLGLLARSVVEGGADLAAPFADVAGMGLNAAVPGQPFNTTHSQSFSDLLTRAGAPAPQNPGEELTNLIGRVGTGVVAGRGIDRAVMGALGYASQPAAAASRAAPTSDQLKDLSRQLYQQAENAGVVIDPKSFANRVGTIAGAAAKEGIDPTLHPMATAALKRLTNAVEAGQPLALQQLETLRKVASGAAGSISKDERRIARIIVDSLDDYALSLSEADVIAGSAGANVGNMLREARGLWSRASKGEVVEQLIERARNRASQFSGSGYENALRTEFRNIVQNPRRLRLFTPVEQNALRTVARGGPVENMLRYLGKLAPTGAVSGAIGAGAGAAVGGVPGAIAVPLAGAAARQGATALTARNARLAAELMRRGGPAAAPEINRTVVPYALGGTPSLYEFLMRKDQR